MTEFIDSPMLWNYRAVFTQDNVAGGHIRVRIVADSRTEILFGTIGEDNYAADRTIEVNVLNSGYDVIANALFPVPTDDHFLPFPHDSQTAVADGAPNQFNNTIKLADGDVLNIIALSLVQAETLTIAVRALIGLKKPSISTASSTGTVTAVTDFDKVS